jgi:hypothetical protein
MQKITVLVVMALSLGAGFAKSETSADASKMAQVKAKTAGIKAAPLPKVPQVSVVEPESALGPQELAIAERVHQGQLPCELGATVHLQADALNPGYFHVHGKGFRYRMHPVVTSTGAVRLEDRKAGVAWLQLGNKSMLMDQNKGRRLADECANPAQMAFAEHMKTNPPPSLIDTTGTGR